MQHLHFKQKLAKMLCSRLKEEVKKRKLPDYQILLVTCEEWTEKHYQLASELIGVSHSSLRRIFLPQNYQHTSFNQRTRTSFCTFLDFDTWNDLEQYVFEQILLDKMKEKQGFS